MMDRIVIIFVGIVTERGQEESFRDAENIYNLI